MIKLFFLHKNKCFLLSALEAILDFQSTKNDLQGAILWVIMYILGF
jgi:hypothetical protein